MQNIDELMSDLRSTLLSFQFKQDVSVAGVLENGYGAGRLRKEVFGWPKEQGGIYFFKLPMKYARHAREILGITPQSEVIYVGRSRKICKRLVDHFKKNSHNTASLVYKITCDKLNASGGSRSHNMADSKFVKEFDAIRLFLVEHVRVAYHIESEPVKQALLEILFSQKYTSDFNAWETH